MHTVFYSLTDYDNKDQSNNTKREEPAMTYETVGPTVPEEPSKNQQTFNSSGQSSTHGNTVYQYPIKLIKCLRADQNLKMRPHIDYWLLVIG